MWDTVFRCNLQKKSGEMHRLIISGVWQPHCSHRTCPTHMESLVFQFCSLVYISCFHFVFKFHCIFNLYLHTEPCVSREEGLLWEQAHASLVLHLHLCWMLYWLGAFSCHHCDDHCGGHHVECQLSPYSELLAVTVKSACCFTVM